MRFAFIIFVVWASGCSGIASSQEDSNNSAEQETDNSAEQETENLTWHLRVMSSTFGVKVTSNFCEKVRSQSAMAPAAFPNAKAFIQKNIRQSNIIDLSGQIDGWETSFSEDLEVKLDFTENAMSRFLGIEDLDEVVSKWFESVGFGGSVKVRISHVDFACDLLNGDASLKIHLPRRKNQKFSQKPVMELIKDLVKESPELSIQEFYDIYHKQYDPHLEKIVFQETDQKAEYKKMVQINFKQAS